MGHVKVGDLTAGGVIYSGGRYPLPGPCQIGALHIGFGFVSAFGFRLGLLLCSNQWCL